MCSKCPKCGCIHDNRGLCDDCLLAKARIEESEEAAKYGFVIDERGQMVRPWQK